MSPVVQDMFNSKKDTVEKLQKSEDVPSPGSSTTEENLTYENNIILFFLDVLNDRIHCFVLYSSSINSLRKIK